MTERLRRVREILRERQLNALLVSLPANRFYLTGFPDDDDGPDESSGVVLVSPSSATLYTGATNTPWATDVVFPDVTVTPWERPWEPFLGAALRTASFVRIGFEDEALTVAAHTRIREAAGDGCALVPVGDGVSRGRSVKDRAEIELISAAIAITDDAFWAATSGLTAGTTERDLARQIDDQLTRHGADAPSFPTIVAAGPHAARPHHEPGERAIGVGEPVIIDMGARLRGYAADLTRTIWVGDATPKLRDIYNVVLAAQEAAIAALRAGVRGQTVDAVARDLIEAAGFGDQFVHGLGHGLGIRVHEAPSLSKLSEDVLAVDEVTTVEPGIYIEGWGGVRIEDVVVIEVDGSRVLTGAPKARPGTSDA